MVYVVQETPGKNILPATRFGDLRIMLPPGNIGFSPGNAVHTLNKEMSQFSDGDYLLLIGDPILIGIATAVAARWNNGKVKMLKWDRQERVYYEVSIDLYNLNRKENEDGPKA
jgi:hypothetical protein